MGYSKIVDYMNPLNIWYSMHDFVAPQKTVKSSQKIQTINNNMNLMRISSSLFVQIAGLSGAAAVAMGAYGSHGFYPRPDVPNELKEVYKTANYYHFLHTLALLAVPLTKRPRLVGSLMTGGILLFCGTCYAYALTGNKAIVRFTPYGGTLLIIAWLSMIF